MNFEFTSISLLVFFTVIFNIDIHSQKCETYEVMKIDSTKQHYIISVEKQGEKSLILSLKRKVKKKDIIVVGNSYRFKLSKNDWTQRFPPDLPNTLVIDGKAIWDNNDDYKVYSTKNLRGLKYVKKCNCHGVSNGGNESN